MALGADFHRDVLFRGTGLEGGAAMAGNGGLLIVGVNVLFLVQKSLSIMHSSI
jgi:hypothetical protein